MQPRYITIEVVLILIAALNIIDAQQRAPFVEIDDCRIVGKWDEFGLNVAQFQSIPYIEPPLHALRWSPPIIVTNYSNTPNVCNHQNKTIDATYHHSRCWQPWYPQGSWPEQSENCVHLDIYSPSFNSNQSLPVMIFFHGGSAFSGGNFQYDFTNFSVAQRLVVVVPNYRLGLLGFLSFNALTQQSNTIPQSSGNYGLMDAQQSLVWVKKYISIFGGNPDDITISGQSTGGTIVLAMFAMPSAHGLFKRAISMSGSPNISMALSTAEKQCESIVDLFGCGRYPNNEMIVQCMRNISAINLTNSYPQTWLDADDKNFGLPGPSKKGFNEAGLIIVDGYLVTQTVFDALENGLNDVPLMLGNTQYETDFSPYVDVRNLTTKAMFTEYLDKQFIEWGATFGSNLWHKYYEEEWTLGGSQLVYDGIATDSTGFCGTQYLANIAANSRQYTSNVYLFSMQQWPSHPFPARKEWNCSYSYHSIGFDAATYSWLAFEYWGTLYFEPQFSDLGFGELIRNHWNHFITHDTPLEVWKPYHKKYGYNVALIGNGPNKFTQYNTTTIVRYYKSDICEYYLQNGIGPTFWWSN